MYVTAAADANSVTPEIDIADYFIHAKNAHHFWIILVVVCITYAYDNLGERTQLYYYYSSSS